MSRLLIYSYCLALLVFLLSCEQSEQSTKTNRLLPFPAEVLKTAKSKVQTSDFAGSLACKSCHQQEYDLWKESTHAKAGGLPHEVKIIAKFDGSPLRFRDAVVIPKKLSSENYVFIIREQNRPEYQLAVSAVVGGGHMIGGGTQSFFTKLEDGSYRFLPFDFIRDENLWFVQLRANQNWLPISKNIALSDLLNWPPRRLLGTVDGMSNCQNCHGSQIVTKRVNNSRFESHFTTLGINCESCHGPGKRHIELMQSADLSTLKDIGIQSLEALSKDASLMVCFQCHATKDQLQPNYLPGDDLESFYSLKMPVLGSKLYLPDGKVREFAYQQNHLFSDCYINGSMTCVDCHSPHSQGYRDITGQKLASPFDDGQCTGCHGNMNANPAAHSFHNAGPNGVRCTDCHMPYLQHRVLGEELRFARSDHTIPIPRAGLESRFGIENSCVGCHSNKTSEWAKNETRRLWGKGKPLHSLVSGLLKADSVYSRTEAAALLLQPDKQHPIAQYTALAEFTKRFLKPDMPTLEEDIRSKLKLLSESNDRDLRAFALMSLHLSQGNVADVRKMLVESLQNAGAQETSLRKRWSITMDYIGSQFFSERDYFSAIRAYNKALVINAKDTFVLDNLAAALEATEDYSSAISTYQRGLTIEPQAAQRHFRLARALNKAKRLDEAIVALKKGLTLDPTNKNQQSILRYLEEQQ
ncbi:MAG: ammonia-forming cytochrome c nitrite reductase subunit c552 [Calditrichia bacterium]